MRDSLVAKLQRPLPLVASEKLVAIDRFLAGEPLPASQPASSELSGSAGVLSATIEGDPSSGHFCIRVAPAKETTQSAPPKPPELDEESLSLAAKVFELLTALDPDNRLRKAPPIKVFLLRFRNNLSRAEIARICHCDRSLVALRLKTIRDKLPWEPRQLREMSAHVEAMQNAVSDSRARRIYRKGAVYGEEEDSQQPD